MQTAIPIWAHNKQHSPRQWEGSSVNQRNFSAALDGVCDRGLIYGLRFEIGLCFELSLLLKSTTHLLQLICAFEVTRCRSSQFARCFLHAQGRLQSDLCSVMFDSDTLNWFTGAVNPSLLPWDCLHIFSSVRACLYMWDLSNHLVFKTWGCGPNFNDNNNINNYIIGLLSNKALI